MTSENRNKYYIDSNTGGVVHSQPTKTLPDLVFTGKNKSPLDLQLEQHARIVQEVLGESFDVGSRLKQTGGIIRTVFVGLSLPLPGLAQLKDNFYTGWFYTTEEGTVRSAFMKNKGKHPSLSVNYGRRDSYFMLDEQEVEFWNSRMKSPLSIEEVKQLFSSPGLEAHPYCQILTELGLKELTRRASWHWIVFGLLLIHSVVMI